MKAIWPNSNHSRARMVMRCGHRTRRFLILQRWLKLSLRGSDRAVV
jgi:hypothetical protein